MKSNQHLKFKCGQYFSWGYCDIFFFKTLRTKIKSWLFVFPDNLNSPNKMVTSNKIKVLLKEKSPEKTGASRRFINHSNKILLRLSPDFAEWKLTFRNHSISSVYAFFFSPFFVNIILKCWRKEESIRLWNSGKNDKRIMSKNEIRT